MARQKISWGQRTKLPLRATVELQIAFGSGSGRACRMGPGLDGAPRHARRYLIRRDRTQTAPVVRQADATPPARPDGPKLTKNQQTMYSLLHDAGAGGLTTEQWNERGRAVDIGVKRKADLYDIRESLKSKNIVRRYGDRWNAC